jgi:hypothetical protein
MDSINSKVRSPLSKCIYMSERQMNGSVSLVAETLADRNLHCSCNRHDNWMSCWILHQLGEYNIHEIYRVAHQFSHDHACGVQLKYGRRCSEECARPQAQRYMRAM